MALKPSMPPRYDAPKKTTATADDVRALADTLLAAGEKLRQLAKTYDAADEAARIGSRAGVLLCGGALAKALQAFAARAAGVLEE
jgi:hypothetical protein